MAASELESAPPIPAPCTYGIRRTKRGMCTSLRRWRGIQKTDTCSGVWTARFSLRQKSGKEDCLVDRPSVRDRQLLRMGQRIEDRGHRSEDRTTLLVVTHLSCARCERYASEASEANCERRSHSHLHFMFPGSQDCQSMRNMHSRGFAALSQVTVLWTL